MRQPHRRNSAWCRAVGGAIFVILLAACQPADFEVGAVEFQAPAGMAPNLTTVGDQVVLSWLEPSRDGQHALRLAVRDGTTWRPAGTVVENDSLFVNWADFPSVLGLSDGRWVAHWLQKTAPSTYAYHVKLAISNDRGATWGEPFVPHGDRSPTEHGFVAMVPWEGGAALAWLDGRRTGSGAESDAGHADRGAMTVRFTTLGTDGLPAPDIEVDDRACDCCQNDMALTSRGLVLVFRDRSPEEIRDIALARYSDGEWTRPSKVADDGWYYPGCPVNGPAVVAAGDTVIVAWYTAAAGPRVYAAISSDGGATFGPRIRVDAGTPTGRTDVAMLPGGGAVVSWIEEADDAGEIMIRRIAFDGQAGPVQVVASTTTARAAGFSRLTRVRDHIVVAWTQPGEGGGVQVASVRPRG